MLLLTCHCLALDLDVRNRRSDELDFSLILEHFTMEISTNQAKVKANFDRIGIVSFEVPVSGPSFGLLLGNAFSDFSSNDVYHSQGLSGYYVGVAVQGYLVSSQWLSLLARGQYVYQGMRGIENSNEYTLTWSATDAQLIAETRITYPVWLYGGTVYSNFYGSYRERGEVYLTDNIKNTRKVGYLAGIRYSLDQRESVGIEYQDGYRNSVKLQFQKYF